MPRALILGADGEDGAYLARLLDARGYTLTGTAAAPLDRLDDLGVRDRVTLLGAGDAAELLAAAHADEIYDLAGDAALTGVVLAALSADETRFVHVAGPDIAPETAMALHAARERGVFAAAGRLFDHVSRLSDAAAPALRIVTAARDAMRGDGIVSLGTPDAARDLGWSPEYVDALWRMLHAATPGDFVIATGVVLSDRDIARHALDYFSGDPARIIEEEAVPVSQPLRADPEQAQQTLGWRAYTHGRDLVRTLCEGVAAP